MDGKRTSDPVYSTAFNDFLGRNKAVVTALSASCISTFAGYPLDSLKSRLQTTKTPISVPRLALTVYRDEGISGFYRGLAIPLLTISFVRAASFTIYNSTKDYFKKREWLVRDSIVDVSIIGGISGAMSGALISVGSTPRDTTGTMLYFLEYDGMRYLLGRQRSGEQGPIPAGLPIPVSLAPFVCGSFAGVSPDPNKPKPFLAGVARIYRGLGVSAVRSITTHGLLWTFFDLVANYIDSLPKHG
ncbi:hypothetical protein HHX47_DHR1000315 [Lentinula edodes]|nr:hypothetical protein HHX47_DHR1000315 [Lentinula edodes]